MGTTLSAIQSSTGLEYRLVLAIEGVEYLVTNGSTSEATTAWAATEWTQALGGLQVSGAIEQRLTPWQPVPDDSRLTFVVQPDSADTLGKLIFGRTATTTQLATAINCTDTSVVGLRTNGFASSGAIHMGPEQIAYSSKNDGTATYTVSKRGMYAPFKASSETQQRFGREHRMPVVGEGVSISPRITSKQTTWAGRWVGLWLHRRVGTTLDTWDQAQCIFAGKIAEVRDDVSGCTIIDCDEIKAALKNTLLMRDQWNAKVVSGIYLRAGQRFQAVDLKGTTVKTANDLLVVSSGTPDANTMVTGYVQIDDLATQINYWLSSEKAAGRLNFLTSWNPRSSDSSGNPRSQFHIAGGSATVANTFALAVPDSDIAIAMGWGDGNTTLGGGFLWTGTSVKLYSLNEPYATYLAGNSVLFEVDVTDIKGTFFDNKTWLPQETGVDPTDSHVIGVVQVGDGAMAIAQQVNSTTYQLVASKYLDKISGSPWSGTTNDWRKIPISQSGSTILLRQVAIIAGSFENTLTRVLASTGTASYNGSYDVLPSQVSCAVPWQLLGANWTTSLDAAAESMGQLLLVIEKPTKLFDCIGTELLARLSQIVWKNQGLRLATWGTPSAAVSSHTFTEADKAAPAGAVDPMRTPAVETQDYLCNSIQLNYDRVLSGGYQSTINLIDPSSQDEFGDHPTQMDMPNHFARASATGATIDDLANTLGSAMSMFREPLRVMTRSIALPHYENVAPGDFCSITDSFARDPGTGARGLTSKPGLIIRHSVTWGGYEVDSGGVAQPDAQVDVVILPLDTIAPYCPCAQVDETQTNAGYNAISHILTCYAHQHSEASEVADATRFAVNDAITIVEIDPDNPASPLSWTRTVSAQSGNTITLSSALSSPAWDATKRYRIISQAYGSATVSQQADVYQADHLDGSIADTIAPYTYAAAPQQAGSYTTEDGTALAALYSASAYGDGVALDVGYERDMARLCNNLQGYRTAPVIPTIIRQGMAGDGKLSGSQLGIVAILPVCLGAGFLLGGDRSLLVRPWFRSATGASVTIQVSLCQRPPTGTSLTNNSSTAPNYSLTQPFISQTWTTSSTTWGAGSQKSLSCSVLDQSTGEGYIVIELPLHGQSTGLAMCQVGAFTSS